jgi:hypothetical protein
VDEFTYLKELPLVAVNEVKADRYWVLSGTPDVDDFADIKK